MAHFKVRHAPSPSPPSQTTPIETKETEFVSVTVHVPPPTSNDGTARPRVTPGKAMPELPKAPEQANAQRPQVDDAHGCCFRGCWSCVGCACFGGFLGALFWARAATDH